MARPSSKKKIKKIENRQYKLATEYFYHTAIHYKDLTNGKELNKHLLKHIKAWKKRDEKGITRSNSLGWHSAVDMHHRKEYQPVPVSEVPKSADGEVVIWKNTNCRIRLRPSDPNPVPPGLP